LDSERVLLFRKGIATNYFVCSLSLGSRIIFAKFVEWDADEDGCSGWSRIFLKRGCVRMATKARIVFEKFVDGTRMETDVADGRGFF